MLIGSNKKLANVSSLSLSIFECDLDRVNKFKYLGIMLASDFTWSDHIEYVISKVNQRLGLLRRIKHLLPFTARLLFYNSLDYGDLVWGDKNNVTLMNDLQILQNKAAKIILDRSLYSSATDTLVTLHGGPLLGLFLPFHRKLRVVCHRQKKNASNVTNLAGN